MSTKYLGERFDIHTGGEDHLFPHHECEIAQNYAGTGHQVVNYWLHRRFILVDGEKMSKSKGNFFRLQDVIDKGFEPMAYRYMVISTHYRSPLNFSWEALAGAKNALNGLRDFVSRLDRVKSIPEQAELVAQAKQEFIAGLDEDLNSAAAFAAIFTLQKEVNRMGGGGREVADFILDVDKVLGLKLAEAMEAEDRLSDDLMALIKEREMARASSNWARADEIRKALLEQSITLEDTPQGTVWRKSRD